jgi:hypothetical protein
MMLPSVLALGLQLTVPVANTVPELNVEQVCDGIARQGGATFHDQAIAKEKQNCLESEQATRDQLARQWSDFNVTDRKSCENEARMGGDSSYTELLTCLEMARDVRAMRAEEAAQSQGDVQAPPNPAKKPR